MFSVEAKTGNIICRQGDSGEFILEGIPEDQAYEVFLAFYNAKRVIIDELSASPIDGQVTFHIPASMTDKLTVPAGVATATYYYGVKICHTDEEGYEHEDTIIVGDKDINEVNKVVVYPKIVEGY